MSARVHLAHPVLFWAADAPVLACERRWEASAFYAPRVELEPVATVTRPAESTLVLGKVTCRACRRSHAFHVAVLAEHKASLRFGRAWRLPQAERCRGSRGHGKTPCACSLHVARRAKLARIAAVIAPPPAPAGVSMHRTRPARPEPCDTHRRRGG